MAAGRKTLAVWKLASCDGCQLSLLDLEAELLPLAARIDFAHFIEMSSESHDGPYDLVLVEGSVSTPEDLEAVVRVRAQARRLVAIGACATAGGIQALRNFASLDAYRILVYPKPEYVQSLARSTPVSDHVPVDYELAGCPIDKRQLLEVILAFIEGRRPQIEQESVCNQCKSRGTTCLTVARSEPCMGPITQAGCGALCPTYGRGCYGCFGPKENANVPALTAAWRREGVAVRDAERLLHSFTCWAPPFRNAK